MRSAFSRQFALVAGLVLASFLVLGGSFAALSFQYTTDRQMDTLEDTAAYLGGFTSSYYAKGLDAIDANAFALQTYISSQASISKAHILLCQADGTVVFSADGQSGGEDYSDLTGETLSGVIVRRLTGDGAYRRLGDLGGLYEEQRYIAGRAIELRGRVIGMIFVSTAADDLTQLWRDLSGIFMLTALVVFVLAAVLTMLATRRQTKPIKEMARAARDFGQGNFDKRVDDTGPIDEMNELARSFNSMAESLAQAEKRRSEFVANISHELKTPMTTISGFADGILDGTIPPEKETAALQTISSETKRLARLVRRMLDISRLQGDQGVALQAQFDIVELTARTMVSLEGKITAKHLDMIAALPEEPIKVWGDPDAITQVCYNLLDNAIKFSREGGHLWVEITAQGAKALVSIRNEGETIPPEELSLIFDRFHKSDKSRSMDREGVGLGLYIVKTILNEHKESIRVTSEDGLTVFQFPLTLV